MLPHKVSDIAKKVSEQSEFEEQKIVDVINSTFSLLKNKMKSYSDIRYNIPGLMAFYFGRSKLQKFSAGLENLKNLKLSDKKYFRRNSNHISVESIVKEKALIDNLLERYDVYVQDRKETKAKYKLEKYGAAKKD